jgi:hypothetical protein
MLIVCIYARCTLSMYNNYFTRGCYGDVYTQSYVYRKGIGTFTALCNGLHYRHNNFVKTTLYKLSTFSDSHFRYTYLAVWLHRFLLDTMSAYTTEGVRCIRVTYLIWLSTYTILTPHRVYVRVLTLDVLHVRYYILSGYRLSYYVLL